MTSGQWIEIFAIASLALCLPPFAMAAWHGWKIEEMKAQQRDTVLEDDS